MNAEVPYEEFLPAGLVEKCKIISVSYHRRLKHATKQSLETQASTCTRAMLSNVASPAFARAEHMEIYYADSPQAVSDETPQLPNGGASNGECEEDAEVRRFRKALKPL